MPAFLGVDAGGTRTTAWVADAAGKVLGRARAGPSNPAKLGFSTARAAIRKAASSALHQARLRSSDLNAVCVGAAGAGRPSVEQPLRAWLRSTFPGRAAVLATSDAALVLEAALGEGAGVVVIAGTGSIAYARDANGRVHRAGGWGIPFDDIGSGYDVGRRAISAALRASDGRGPATRLERALAHHLGIREITEVAGTVLAPHQVAALFPVVAEEAGRRDMVARRLCQEAGQELAGLAMALIRRLGWQRSAVRVWCSGGVLRSSALVRHSFARALRTEAPRARIAALRKEPVEGALALARKLAVGGRG